MRDEGRIRVLIADDHQMFLDGLYMMLAEMSHIEMVGSAGNGLEVLKHLQKGVRVDVVVSDIAMPVMNGIELSEKLREFYPDINMLMVSMHDQPDIVLKVLNAGAIGYILKNTDRSELRAAIDAVGKGETYFSEAVKSKLVGSLAMAGKNSLEEVSLTGRESDVIRLIAKEYTTAEIAEELFISLHTVESHRKNLLRKTKSRNIAGLVRYALEKNLIL